MTPDGCPLRNDPYLPCTVHSKPCDLFDCVNGLFLFQLHMFANLVAELPDVVIKLFDIGKDFAHHFLLERGDHAIGILQDLFLDRKSVV